MPIETFNISFKNTQNKQQYGTKITCTEGREKKVMESRTFFLFFIEFFVVVCLVSK